MENLRSMCAIALGLIFLMGCIGSSSLVKFVKEGGLETKGLTNLALVSSGARVIVPQDNPDHPAHTLINGITTSENWDRGEGWELEYEGWYARGGHLEHRVVDPMLAGEPGFIESSDPSDPSWRGLRIQTSLGDAISAALGWIIVEFPEEKTVNRAIIYTIDSDRYPAEKFGVSDLMLQYWSNAANNWAMVERLGKDKGQPGNTIRGNKHGVMMLRFQPVKTSRIRIVIRWTNDSKSHKRGYYRFSIGTRYSSATIRLVEVEIYGYEREEVDEEEPSGTSP